MAASLSLTAELAAGLFTGVDLWENMQNNIFSLLSIVNLFTLARRIEGRIGSEHLVPSKDVET